MGSRRRHLVGDLRAFDPTVTVTRRGTTPCTSPATGKVDPRRSRGQRPPIRTRKDRLSRSTLPRDAPRTSASESWPTRAGKIGISGHGRRWSPPQRRSRPSPVASPRSVASSRICMINSPGEIPGGRSGRRSSSSPVRALGSERKRPAPLVDAAAEHGVRRGDLADLHRRDLQLTGGHLGTPGGFVTGPLRSRAPAPTGRRSSTARPRPRTTTPTRSPDRNPCRSGRSAPPQITSAPPESPTKYESTSGHPTGLAVPVICRDVVRFVRLLIQQPARSGSGQPNSRSSDHGDRATMYPSV